MKHLTHGILSFLQFQKHIYLLIKKISLLHSGTIIHLQKTPTNYGSDSRIEIRSDTDKDPDPGPNTNPNLLGRN